MAIEYTDEKHFTQDQIHELFASVGWESAQYPDRVYFVKSVFWFWSCSFFGFGHWGMLVVVDWLLVWSNMRASLMR
ncbi:GCN5 family acetyltransferase, partial [Bifidobacterium pseudolongum subsp. globosum]